MKPRLLADENTSHRMVSACRQLDASLPITLWKEGKEWDWADRIEYLPSP